MATIVLDDVATLALSQHQVSGTRLADFQGSPMAAVLLTVPFWMLNMAVCSS